LDQCALQAVLQTVSVEPLKKVEEYPGEQDHVLDCPGKVKNDAERNRNEYFTFAILNGRFVEVPEIHVKSRIISKNV
jgi:hypothetical protein